MPDFAANLSTMFIDLPVLDRLAAVASRGFTAVELAAIDDCPPQAVARGMHGNGLTLVAYHLTAERGGPRDSLACDPDRRMAFRDLARRGIEIAGLLNSRFVVCRAGALPAGCSKEKGVDAFIDNLRFAADAAMASGLCLLLEAVDTESLPGAYPHSTRQALEILEAVGARNLSLLYDAGHMQAMGEPVRKMIARHLPRIGHIQIAGHPGRGEPTSGETDLDDLLAYLHTL